MTMITKTNLYCPLIIQSALALLEIHLYCIVLYCIVYTLIYIYEKCCYMIELCDSVYSANVKEQGKFVFCYFLVILIYKITHNYVTNRFTLSKLCNTHCQMLVHI